MRVTCSFHDRPGNAPGERRTRCESLALAAEDGPDMAALTELHRRLVGNGPVPEAIRALLDAVPAAEHARMRKVAAEMEDAAGIERERADRLAARVAELEARDTTGG